jgi:hypothetical protein
VLASECSRIKLFIDWSLIAVPLSLSVWQPVLAFESKHMELGLISGCLVQKIMS